MLPLTFMIPSRRTFFHSYTGCRINSGKNVGIIKSFEPALIYLVYGRRDFLKTPILFVGSDITWPGVCEEYGTIF